MVGQLIGDRYEILKNLGSGNMSKTYLTQDLQHPESAKCVIKYFIPAQSDAAWLTASQQLFTKEAESLKLLGSHSQIPQLLDYFEHQGEFYLVQEFIQGHPLSAELTIGGRWQVPQVIQFLADMLQLLVFVHSQGMIHRDIKPSNIMRRQADNQLVLIDFGAVKQVPARQPQVDGQTSVTVVVGTPGYMPTEQANGNPQPSSDIYALGMIAIQALTGLLPRQLREDEDGEWVWREQAEVGDEFAAVLAQMVRHYHKHRFQSAAQVLQVIQSLQETSSEAPVNDVSSSATTATDITAGPSKTPTVQAIPKDTTPSDPPKRPTQSAAAPSVQSRSVNRRHAKWGWAGAGAIALIATISGSTYLVHTKTLSEYERQVLRLDNLQQAGQYQDCFQQAETLPAMNAQWTKAAQIIIDRCEAGQAQATTLEDIQALQEKQDFDGCVEDAQAFTAPDNPDQTAQALQLLGQCQLSQARQLANAGRFADAIALSDEIAPESDSYGEAQKLLSQWSYRILELAEETYTAQGDMDSTEALIAAIPESAPAYSAAQKALARLREDRDRNQGWLAAARDAFHSEQWEDAIASAGKITLPSMLVERDYIIDNSRKGIEDSRQQLAELEPFLAKESVLTSSQVDAYRVPYHEYDFEGQADKTVVVIMESDEFDTFVELIGPDGLSLASSDDRGPGDYNSSITIPLPEDGKYVIKATAYNRFNRGEYQLTARYLAEPQVAMD